MPTATARPASGANLAPYVPQGWASPLIVSSAPNAQQNSALVVGGPVYVSFALNNAGSESTASQFFADILFDGVVVHRVNFGSIQPRFFSRVPDWAELPATVRITPGRHRIRVVIDPTDLAAESDESDNLVERELEWATPSPPPATTPAPRRQPNLAPARLAGWDGAIVATSAQDDITYAGASSGPLSVDVPTYLSYGLENSGPTSIAGAFWAYTYLDGLLVDRLRFAGLLSATDHWRGPLATLAQTLPLTPGLHTLRVEVDATQLIDESDETDNVFEQRFFWGVGPVSATPTPTPVPAAAPTPPSPLTLPNLVPGWLYPSDGPIIVAASPSTDFDSQPYVGGPAYLTVVLQNSSTMTAPGAAGIDADLFYDGSLVRRFESAGDLGGRSIQWWPNWDGLPQAVALTPGPHVLKLVIDPGNRVAEADETDNVFEKTVIWGAVPAPTPTPRVYTDAQLDAKLADLIALLDTRELAVGGPQDLRARVLEVADAGHYLVTGKSLLDERVQINLLPGAEFREWTDSHYAEKFAVSPAGEYARLLEERERSKYRNRAYQARRFGRPQLVIDAERAPAELLRVILHEYGHARQDLLRPDQSPSSPGYNLDALQEAEAQQWEVVVLRALEQRTRLSLSAYPDLAGYRSLVDSNIDYLIRGRTKDEHWQGYLLLWGAALADDVPGLRQAVLAGPLSSASGKSLYDFLLNLPPANAEAYVDSRVQLVIADGGAQLKTLLKGRLIAGLATDLEGPAGLRDTFLRTP